MKFKSFYLPHFVIGVFDKVREDVLLEANHLLSSLATFPANYRAFIL